MWIPNPSPIQYFGRPSVEIDQAWEDLIGRKTRTNSFTETIDLLMMTAERYFLVSEEEAKATWPDHYEEYWHEKEGGYYTGSATRSCQVKTLTFIASMSSILYTAW